MSCSSINWETMQYRRMPHPRANWFLNDDQKESHVNKKIVLFPIRAKSQTVILCLWILFTLHQGVASGHLPVQSKSFSIPRISWSCFLITADWTGPSALHSPYSPSPNPSQPCSQPNVTTSTWMPVHSHSFPTHFHSKHQSFISKLMASIRLFVDSAFCASFTLFSDILKGK